jgi:AcrR family transcriptional regulator
MSSPPSSALSRGRPQLLAGEDLPPLPQQERSRLKREALLQAGLQLFEESGYEATTVEAVAQRASVALGGFYQHFRSKRQLLLVLMDRLVQEIADVDLRLEFGADAEPSTVLERLVRFSLSLDLAYAGVHRAWGEVIIHDAELAAYQQDIERWTAELAHGLMQGIALLPGARSDLDLHTLSWIVTLLFWKLAAQLAASPTPLEVDAIVRGLVHLLYHALFEDRVG